MYATQMLAFMADGIQGREIFYLIASIVLLLSAIVLIVAVLIQSNSSKGLSGTIAGGSDTFYGRNKGKSIDKKLTIVTIVLAVVFAVLSLAIFAVQSKLTAEEWFNNLFGNSSSTTSSDEYEEEKEGENSENKDAPENEVPGENVTPGDEIEDENQGGTTEDENQGGTTEDENQGGETEGETNGGEDANN